MAKRATDVVALGQWRAIWLALRDADIAHYPRVETDAGWTSLNSKQIAEEIAPVLQDLTPDPDALDTALEQTSQSLDEVKSQTEYQDGKATRLLTIITFVGALAGALFGKILDSYPPHASFHVGSPVQAGLIAAAYAGFGAFALLAACGALVTFHAIRIRFRYDKALVASREADTRSYLFYQSMLEVRPARWADSFVAKGDPTRITRDLKMRYLRNHITETYLIAAKVADKVRLLEPAQALQGLAIRVLVFWLLVVALTFAVVPPVEKATGSGPTPDPTAARDTQGDSNKASSSAMPPTGPATPPIRQATPSTSTHPKADTKPRSPPSEPPNP